MQAELSYRHIWKVTYPLILGGVAQTFINVTDVAFLGRVDEVALGASAIAGMFFVVLFMPGFGFTIGAQILIARLDGERQYHRIGKIFNHVMYFLMLMALLFYALTYTLGTAFLERFVSSPEILAESVRYLDIRAYGFFFAFGVATFRALYAGTSDTNVISYATGIMAVINFILNYLLIFGKFGLPEMGIQGAALGSVIAELIAFVYYVLYTLYNREPEKYNLLPLSKLDFGAYRRILKISLPIMLQFFLSIGSWFAFFMIIENMGETALAASNVMRSVYMIMMIPLFGFSTATNTLVSNIIGQGKHNLVMPLIWRIIKLSVISSGIMILIILMFPETMLSVFTNQQHLVAISVDLIYVISGALMVFSVALIVFSGVSGTGNTLMTLMLECITLLAYLVFTYYLAIVKQAPLPVVWASEYVYFTGLGLTAWLYLKFGNWRGFQLT